jgi:hypothetical protein
VFRRPELLVAASVPVLLLAGVLPWHRDVLCTRSGCGTVTASAWTGSPVWAAVLVVALALGGVWVLLAPTRGEVPLGVAALTGVAGVVSAAIVLVSLDALVFNRAGFFGFDLPVTETFPVLAVHPGPGLLVGLLGLLLQAAGGWTSVRHRTALLTTPRRHRPHPQHPTPPQPAHPWQPAPPPPAQPWDPAPPAPAQPWEPAPPQAARGWGAAAPEPARGRGGTAPTPAQSWGAAPEPAQRRGAAPEPAQSWRTQPPSPSQAWEAAAPAKPSGAGVAPASPPQAGPAREAAAFGQGAPPPRRRRRRDDE